MEAVFCVKYPVSTLEPPSVSSGNDTAQPSPEMVLAPHPSPVLLLLTSPVLLWETRSGVCSTAQPTTLSLSTSMLMTTLVSALSTQSAESISAVW